MDLKEAIEYVAEGLAPTGVTSLSAFDDPVFDKPVYRAPHPLAPPLAAALNVSTLRSFAEYVTANRDGLDLTLHVIHVESPVKVALVGPLEEFHRRREVPIAATYAAGESILDKWVDLETAVIALMTGFTNFGDRDVVLGLLKQVTSEGLEIREDDGLSQSVTVSRGVATLGRTSTPNPISLAPYRTFTEVETQPPSLFILRLQQGPRVLIKSADGGDWKVKAAEGVAVALERMLSDGHPPILH